MQEGRVPASVLNPHTLAELCGKSSSTGCKQSCHVRDNVACTPFARGAEAQNDLARDSTAGESGGMRMWIRVAAGVSTACAVLALVAGSSGCGQKPANATESKAPVLGPEHRFAITVGGQSTNLRLAVHDSERSRGLMEVTAMPEADGMLFVWANPQAMSFYMRNTKLPLDIGFFDPSGVLQEIYPMYPGVEDSVRSRSDKLQFALEMNRGWYTRHHVTPGATIDLAAVRDALKQRGYDPEKFLSGK
jgi:hypothetical protein